ncbi:MAG: DUF3105 domain-containing protein [Anaerolineae bacterium]
MTKSKKARERGREARRRLHEKRRRQERMMIVGGILAATLIVVWLVYAATRPKPGRAVPDMGNLHIQPPQTAEHNSTPPTSGPHYTQMARWGIHAEPIPNELQVHNLEDGGVMVQYNCPEGCEDLVAQLADIVSRYDEHAILAPYPEMESRIALTAWGRIDTFDRFDEERIVKFIEAYQGIDHHR